MRLNELTALYSPLDVEYNQAMSGPYQDLSYHGQDCMVVAGLKDGRITGFWRPVVAVGDAKALKLHIERLYDISREIVYMDFLEGGGLSVISRFLLRQGYGARPYYTQIIDLTKTEEELHADLRKSYKSLINSVEGGIWTSGSINKFKEMHIEQRGRQTRNNRTWEIQAEMIRKEQAYGTGTIPRTAGCLIYHNHTCAYYAVGASDKGKNAHAAMWKAILEAKEFGCQMFEMGEQVFSGDPKLVNISKFKRGFGGQTYTRLILEKESK